MNRIKKRGIENEREYQIDEISRYELDERIRKIKVGKACGSHNIEPTIMKYLGSEEKT